MEDTFIVSGLAKRRAALAGDIGRMQTQLRQMLIDLETLDAAIRIFDADFPIQEIKPKGLRPASNWTTRGEFVRLIFSILRKASEPLSAQDIAREVMVFKQLDTNNQRDMALMRKRVSYALVKKRKSGQLRSHWGPGPYVLWEIAAPITPPSAANSLSTAC